MKKSFAQKIGLGFLSVLLPCLVSAQGAKATMDAKGGTIDGTWAATTNTLVIPAREYWLYLSVQQGNACVHTLFVKGGCPSKCYPVTKGAFEAEKVAYNLELNMKDQSLMESWKTGTTPASLVWVKYALPTGCSVPAAPATK